MNSAVNAFTVQVVRYVIAFCLERVRDRRVKLPSTQTQVAKASAVLATATRPRTKASPETPRSFAETPFQRMIRASGMLPPMTEERVRETQKELERIRIERPDFYQALVESKERLTKVADAMYPSPEEYNRLLKLDNPMD